MRPDTYLFTYSISNPTVKLPARRSARGGAGRGSRYASRRRIYPSRNACSTRLLTPEGLHTVPPRYNNVEIRAGVFYGIRRVLAHSSPCERGCGCGNPYRPDLRTGAIRLIRFIWSMLRTFTLENQPLSTGKERRRGEATARPSPVIDLSITLEGRRCGREGLNPVPERRRRSADIYLPVTNSIAYSPGIKSELPGCQRSRPARRAGLEGAYCAPFLKISSA